MKPTIPRERLFRGPADFDPGAVVECLERAGVELFINSERDSSSSSDTPASLMS